ncbi:MAG: hypothetical protein HXX80_04695 [Nitrososphaerales archaeon]|nr:hypothetical protein [Nitrososphaerales archaeon]
MNLLPAPNTQAYRTTAYIVTWYHPPATGFEAASIQGAIWRALFPVPYGIISTSSVVTRLNQIYNDANGKDVVRAGDALSLSASKSTSFTITATLTPAREGVKIIFSTTEVNAYFDNDVVFTNNLGQATVTYFGEDVSKVTAYTKGVWPTWVDLINNRYQDLIRIEPPVELTATVEIPPAQTYSIFGYKFNDMNNNTIFDGSDVKLEGWRVELWNASGLIRWADTNSIGYYEFTGLKAGSYIVKEIGQTGWVNTTLVEVPIEIVDSDKEVNFGNFELGVKGGYKWEDSDGDGIWDDGEPKLDGWEIKLFKWDELLNDWVYQSSAITGDGDWPNGYYNFIGLTIGLYKVQEVNKTGWTPTHPVNPPYHIFTVTTSGFEELNNNFGNTQGTTINANVRAEGNWTRTFEWDISKSVTPDKWDLFVWDSATSLYNVTVTKGTSSEEAYINGTVCVTNTGSLPTVDLKIKVELRNATTNAIIVSPFDVDVSAMPILNSLQSHCYEFLINIPSDDINTGDYNVTAYVTIKNYLGHIGVDFGPTPSDTLTLPPPKLVYDVIHVDDDMIPNIVNPWDWEFGNNGSVTYEKYFQCNNATITNTATIIETGQSDDASVTVNCYELEVTKDANTWFTRKYKWKIEKWANYSICKPLCLSPGEKGNVSYYVMVWVNQTVDKYWKVNGTVTICNPAPIPAKIISYSDVISGVGTATVNFGVSFPYTLAPGDTLTGTYSKDLPNNSTRTNTVTVEVQKYDFKWDGTNTTAGTIELTATAPIDFKTATITLIDECIHVTDKLYIWDCHEWHFVSSLDLGSVCYTDAPYTFHYIRTFGPYEFCAYYYKNTATFETCDTHTTDSDSSTIKVVKKKKCC